MQPVSLMRLRKIKSPEDLLERYDESDLIVQPKFDGHLALVTTDKSGKVRIYTRRGNEVTNRLPTLVKAFDDVLPPDSGVLGEVVYVNEKGQMDLHGLQSIMKSKGDPTPKKGEVRYFVFDMLRLDGEPYERYPYRERLMRAGAFVRSAGHPVYEAGAYTFDEWPAVVEESIAMGGEGAVFKLSSGEFKLRPLGASEAFGDQYKYKGPGKDQEADVVLTSYTKGKQKRIFTAMQLKDGDWFEVGKLSGLDRESEDQVASRIDAGEKVVAGVTFQQRLKSGKLRHMGWSRLRLDKPIHSVTLEESEMPAKKKPAKKKMAKAKKAPARKNAKKAPARKNAKKAPARKNAKNAPARKNAKKTTIGKRAKSGAKSVGKKISKAAGSDVGRAAIGGAAGGMIAGPVGAAAGAGLAVAANNPTGIATYETKLSKSEFVDDCLPMVLSAFRADMMAAIQSTDMLDDDEVAELTDKDYWLKDWLSGQVSQCLSMREMTFSPDYSKYEKALMVAARKQLRPMVSNKAIMAFADRINPRGMVHHRHNPMRVTAYGQDHSYDSAVDEIEFTDPDTMLKVTVSRVQSAKVDIQDMDDPRRSMRVMAPSFDAALDAAKDLTNNPRKGMMSRSRPGRMDYMTHRGDMDYHRGGHDVVPRPYMNPSSMYRKGFVDRMSARSGRRSNPDYNEFYMIDDARGVHEKRADDGLLMIAQKIGDIEAARGQGIDVSVRQLSPWMNAVEQHLKAAMDANNELKEWEFREGISTDADDEYLRLQTKLKRARKAFSDRIRDEDGE